MKFYLTKFYAYYGFPGDSRHSKGASSQPVIMMMMTDDHDDDAKDDGDEEEMRKG